MNSKRILIAIISASVLAGAMVLPGAAEPVESNRIKQVIVVFKTHFDIGHTDMASRRVETYRTRFMDSALRVVDESRSLPPEQQFVWKVPGWPMPKIQQDWPRLRLRDSHPVRQLRGFSESLCPGFVYP